MITELICRCIISVDDFVVDLLAGVVGDISSGGKSQNSLNRILVQERDIISSFFTA